MIFEISKMRALSKILGIAPAAFALLLVWATAVPAAHAAASAISNSSVRLEFNAGDHAPELTSLKSSSGYQLTNRAEEPLPSAVEINGATVPLIWNHKQAQDLSESRHIALVYESDKPHLRLRWEWNAGADFGAIEHHITIDNLSGQELWLPMIDSLRLDWQTPANADLRNFYVEKGAGTPSVQGTHLDTVADGYQWTGTSSTYAHPPDGAAREIIPAEFVYTNSSPQQGWYAGIEFSGRTRISLVRKGAAVQSSLGLNPEPGPFRTRLVPGGSFETPTAFLGAFSGGPDGAGNQLRPWVRAVLGNPLTWKDEHYPVTVNNSWGSGMQVDEKLALRMIGESKELGLEMFHIDAGWFRGVGDWYPDPK
jgi:hypothetical protein